MAKKVRKSPKSLTKAAKKGLVVKRKPTFWDTAPKNEIERQEFILKLTQRVIDQNPRDIGMKGQADRIRAYIEELKKS